MGGKTGMRDRPPAEFESWSALIMSYVGNHPDCTAEEIADRYGINRSLISSRLGSLLSQGRLRETPGCGAVRRVRVVE